jgi:hypothetical protein
LCRVRSARARSFTRLRCSWSTSTVDLPPETSLQLRSDDRVGDSSIGKPQEQSEGPGPVRQWEGATKRMTVAPNRWSSTMAGQELAHSPWCPESRRDSKAAGANARSQRRCRAEAALSWCWARTGVWWCWTVAAPGPSRGGLCPPRVRGRTDPRTREPQTRLPPPRLRPRCPHPRHRPCASPRVSRCLLGAAWLKRCAALRRAGSRFASHPAPG